MATKEMSTAFLHSFKYQLSSCRRWTQMQQGQSTAGIKRQHVRTDNKLDKNKSNNPPPPPHTADADDALTSPGCNCTCEPTN